MNPSKQFCEKTTKDLFIEKVTKHRTRTLLVSFSMNKSLDENKNAPSKNRILLLFHPFQKAFWGIKKGRLLCNNQGIYPTSPYISFWGLHLPSPLGRRRLWMVPK